MNLKDLLEELKATTIETDGDVVLILKNDKNELDVRYYEDTKNYELFSMDVIFEPTALGKYVFYEDDEDAEGVEACFEVLGGVPEDELLAHLSSIFAFDDYEISAEY